MGLDIRGLGDGNMGARNTFHSVGPRFATMVAVIDFGKGALAVALAGALGLPLGLQLAVGLTGILGHDFPVFARFRGGQGTATSLGIMLVLFPVPTLEGLSAYAVLYLLIRKSNASCGIGGATVAMSLAVSHEWALLGYAVFVFLCIPAKLAIDAPRRRAIELARGGGA